MRKYLLPILMMSLLYWSCEEEALPEDCLGIESGNNICGCTNSLATNYDSTATFDDSSCVFPTEVTLWGVTYSVAETDSLNLSFNQFTGSIPPEI